MNSAFPINLKQIFLILNTEEEMESYLKQHQGKLYTISNSKSGFKELKAIEIRQLSFEKKH